MTFQPASALVWSLGEFDSPDLSFNGYDDAGVEWICEHPAAWDKVSAEVPSEDLPGDGSRPGPGRYKERVINLRGAFRGDPSLLEAAEWRLRDALERVRSDQTLSVTEPVPKSVTVRLTGDFTVDYFNRRTRTFSAVLTAHDPLKYAAGAGGLEVVQFVLRNPADEGGVVFPVTFPMQFSGGQPDVSRQVVDNIGRVPVQPLLKFTGQASGPRLVRVSGGGDDGRPVVIDGSYYGVTGELPANLSAEADLSTRSLLIDGASRISRRYPGSTHWSLASGRNDLRFVADAYSATATAQLSYRPAWR